MRLKQIRMQCLRTQWVSAPRRLVEAAITACIFAVTVSALKAETDAIELAPRTVLASHDANRFPLGWGSNADYGLVLTAWDLRGHDLESGAAALRKLPGVHFADAFGDNDLPKLSLRGSDLAAFPSKKGALLLWDGMPLNFVDGSYVLALIPPRMQALSVVLGNRAIGTSAPTLGGVVAFQSVGAGADSGGSMSFAVGSAGRRSLSIGQRYSGPDFGIRLAATARASEGYRPHNSASSRWLELSGRYRLGDATTLTAGLLLSTFQHDVPGPLNPAQLQRDPFSVAPGFVPGQSAGVNTLRDLPQRSGQYARIGLVLKRSAVSGQDFFGVHASRFRDQFSRPVALGIEDSLSHEVGLQWQTERALEQLPLRPLLQLRGNLAYGERKTTFAHNAMGAAGQHFGRFDMPALSANLAAGLRFEIGTQSEIHALIHYSHARRTLNDRFAEPSRRPGYGTAPPPPAPMPLWGEVTDLEWREHGWIGSLEWRRALGRAGNAYLRWDRTWEAPVFDDLLHLYGGSPNRGPQGMEAAYLAAQRKDTVEAGWQLRYHRLEWSFAAYTARLRNEILTLSDGGALSRSINSSSATRHRGIETAAELQLLAAARARSGSGVTDLRLRVIAEWTDYRFRAHPLYAANRLPGIAPARFRVELPLTLATAGFVVLEWEQRHGLTAVDFANTQFLQPVNLLHLRFGKQRPAGLNWFVELRNLGDRRYAASSIVVERVATPIAAVYFPAEGRNLRAGFEVSW